MDCPECGEKMLTYPVPMEYRDSLPEETTGAASCTHCLALSSVRAPPSETPDFQRISDAFPTDQEGALPMALALGLLSSLALHRSDIETLMTAVERAGADPMLVVDRVASDPGIESHVDLDGRRRQLEQLI